MHDKRKLELTLASMLPYGLTAKLMTDVHEEFSLLETDDFEEIFKEGAIWKYCGYADKDLCIPLGEGEFNGWILRNNNTYADINSFCKPLLHSLSKLTEGVLEGGKIPLVELAKIHNKNNNWGISGQSVVGNGHTFYYDKAYGSFVACYGFPVISNPVNFQIELFEKLKEWHFNVYDLPKSDYLEKSEHLITNK